MFNCYFNYFCAGTRSRSKIILNEEGQIILTTAESRVENLVHSVQNGSVTVATLKMLEKHQNQFISLGEIFQKQSKAESASAAIKVSFGDRIGELTVFRNQKTQLDYFIGICEAFPASKYIPI